MAGTRCALLISEDHGEQWLRAESALDLIEWIYFKYPQEALRLLRRRIIFSQPPTEFEMALIKVAAKRFAVGDLPATSEAVAAGQVAAMRAEHAQLARQKYMLEENKMFKELSNAARWISKETTALQEANKSKGQTFARDRAVVAAVFDIDSRLIAAARNTNVRIRTRHAEMNLLEALDESAAPAFLIVSLQCCRMCAAAVRERIDSSWPDLKVYFLNKEPALATVATRLFGVESHLTALRD